MISRTIRPVVSYFMFCAMLICAVGQQNALAAPFIPGGKLNNNAFTLREMQSASPALVQKLNTKTSRAAMLSSLMANPKTKSLLTTELASKGFDINKINDLGTTAIQASSANKNQPAQISVEEAELRKLSWDTGLTFSPLSAPAYCNGKYMAGVVTVYDCCLSAAKPDIAYMDLPTPDPKAKSEQTIVGLPIEFPTQPGLYTITIKMTTSYGSCPAGMVGPYRMDGSTTYPIKVSFAHRADNTWKFEDIYFTPLLDQSGYVGVVNINPTNGMTGYEMMRSANAVICLWYCPAYAVAIPGSNTLYFKSVIVTRL